MTRREELQDKYEDALFALVMYDIATAQAKEAEEENERLKNDPTFFVPEDVDRRCLKTIRRHFAKQNARAVGRSAVKVAKRVLIAAGLAAILVVTAFAASETIRTKALNLIIQVFETHTDLDFNAASRDDNMIPQVKVGWFPDGFSLINQDSDNFGMWLEYRNPDDDFIEIDIRKTTGLGASIDTEDAEVEYITIRDMQAMLVEKEELYTLVWVTRDNSILISVTGYNISRDNILRVATELSY